MTALEALRLDLMRLHAGKASLDELTQDVAEARRIGEEIDAEMKGRDAVRDLLADELTTPWAELRLPPSSLGSRWPDGNPQPGRRVLVFDI